MFRFPSHKNSNNERTARRQNAKADVVKTAKPTGEQEMERMKNTAAALVADNKISVVNYGHCNGYRIQLSPMNWREVVANGKFSCQCADNRRFDTCAHVIAAEIFAAAQEAETAKQAKIALARQLLAALENDAIEERAQRNCRFCGKHASTGLDHLDCELGAFIREDETETPSKGFVNVSRPKVLAAAERVKQQDFSCRVRKTDTGRYEVYSFASTNTYRVELNRGIFGVTGTCGCFDFEFARLTKDEVCKHLCAVYFFERQERVVSLNEIAIT